MVPSFCQSKVYIKNKVRFTALRLSNKQKLVKNIFSLPKINKSCVRSMTCSGQPLKMGSLVDYLDYVRIYLDNLLVLINGSFDDHLTKLGKVLELLSQTGLKCNANQYSFGAKEVEYLEYFLPLD